jgi:hypothetical protein
MPGFAETGTGGVFIENAILYEKYIFTLPKKDVRGF